MGISWDISIEGAHRVEGALNLSAKNAHDTFYLMQRMVLNLMEIEKAVFSGQGRRGGGSWKRLAPSTVRKKGTTKILRTDGAKPGYSKIDGSTSVDTLYNSLTKLESPYQTLVVTNDSFAFGTTRPMAARINQTRPFLRVLPTDIDRWTRWMSEHIMAPLITE